MKILWVPILAILFPVLFLDFMPGAVPAVSDRDFIDWQSDRKLTWDDFTGKPEQGTDRAALSSIQIHVDFQFANNDLQWNIRCRFNKKKSWGRSRTDYILSHEQAHFDITEYHARKLNERLTIYKKSGEKDHSRRLQSIYEETMREENKMQETYDRETRHSILTDKQAIWLKKVDSLLSVSNAFAGYRDQNKP